MRFIIKPTPPQLTTNSYADYATALGNAVGRFCSFCEKALTYRLLLFHKQQGMLALTAQPTSQDWADLLLVCGDCASSVSNFNAQTAYFWPDSLDAQQSPYLYNKVDNVASTAQDDDGAAVAQMTDSVILVSVSTDVSQQIQTAATNTYRLFRLNGRFFNENFQHPAYTLPYAEYVHSSDARLIQRGDAWARGAEAGAALARGLPTVEAGGGRAYVRNLLAMVNVAVNGFGYLSTWQAAIVATLNATDQTLLPLLVALMTGGQTGRLDRKRTTAALDDGIQQASEVASDKRSRLEVVLGQIIQAQG